MDASGFAADTSAAPNRKTLRNRRRADWAGLREDLGSWISYALITDVSVPPLTSSTPHIPTWLRVAYSSTTGKHSQCDAGPGLITASECQGQLEQFRCFRHVAHPHCFWKKRRSEPQSSGGCCRRVRRWSASLHCATRQLGVGRLPKLPKSPLSHDPCDGAGVHGSTVGMRKTSQLMFLSMQACRAQTCRRGDGTCAFGQMVHM